MGVKRVKKAATLYGIFFVEQDDSPDVIISADGIIPGYNQSMDAKYMLRAADNNTYHSEDDAKKAAKRLPVLTMHTILPLQMNYYDTVEFGDTPRIESSGHSNDKREG